MTESPPLHGIDGGRSLKGKLPWDRDNLRGCLGGSDEKKVAKVDARISSELDRAVTKLVQQRILPEIETRSDAIYAGLNMVLAFARVKGKDSPSFAKTIDIMRWNEEVDEHLNYVERIKKILEKTEQGLEDARLNNRKKKFLALYASLEHNRDQLEEEELVAEARRIWMKYRDHAKTLT